MLPHAWHTQVAAAAVTLGVLLAAPPSILAAETVTPLVSVEWLRSNLGSDDLIVIDIRGSSSAAFAEAHVPGAVWSEYPGAWRGAGSIPGAVPAIADIENHLSTLGVSAGKTVVIVPAGTGGSEFGGAARVHWTLKYLGHDSVAILDGGWNAWIAGADTPTAAGEATPVAQRFAANLRPEILATTAMVSERLGSDTILVDARSSEQYLGLEKSGAVSRPGRIPGAIHLDSVDFYDAATNRLKPVDELERIAAPAVGGDAEIIAYCIGGHLSATNWFVFHELLGYANARLYVDSMAGWSADPARPVVIGANLPVN